MSGENGPKKKETAIARVVDATIEPARDLSTMLTPATAARALGVTRSRINALVKAGRLHPLRDDAGTRHFDRAELLDYARSRRRGPLAGKMSNGRLAALVFDMFTQGAGLRAIVRETLLPPEEVRRLFREWSRPLTADESERAERQADRDAERNHEFLLQLMKTRERQAEAYGRRKKGNGKE